MECSSTQHGKHKTLRQDRRAGRARQLPPWGLYQRNSIALQYSGLRIELLCHESQRLLSLHRPVQTRSQSDDTSESVSRRSGRSQRREGHARLGPQAALERAPHGLAHPMLLQVLHHRWLRSVPRRRTAGRVVAGFFRAAEGDGEEREGGLGALGAEQAHGER